MRWLTHEELRTGNYERYTAAGSRQGEVDEKNKEMMMTDAEFEKVSTARCTTVCLSVGVSVGVSLCASLRVCLCVFLIVPVGRLCPHDIAQVLGMTKEAFEKVPAFKKPMLKKKAGLGPYQFNE